MVTYEGVVKILHLHAEGEEYKEEERSEVFMVNLRN